MVRGHHHPTHIVNCGWSPLDRSFGGLQSNGHEGGVPFKVTLRFSP